MILPAAKVMSAFGTLWYDCLSNFQRGKAAHNDAKHLITARKASIITCPKGNHSCSPRDNKKCPTEVEHFCIRPKVEIISSSFESTVWYRENEQISCDIVDLSCDLVRYREYRPIKCCTKFAPKSHQLFIKEQKHFLPLVSTIFAHKLWFCSIAKQTKCKCMSYFF